MSFEKEPFLQGVNMRENARQCKVVSDRAVIHNYGLKTTNVERRSILSKEYHIKKKCFARFKFDNHLIPIFFVENEGNAFFFKYKIA